MREAMGYPDPVSIHAPARGATAHSGHSAVLDRGFNPRARTGRDSGCSSRTGSTVGFNPRARTGRDADAVRLVPHRVVSIHAPARGATARGLFLWQGAQKVSIHAPARGATRCSCRSRKNASCFNPRARTGRDDPRGRQTIMQAAVSIHAPARGATLRQLGVLPDSVVSIHAPARGATLDHVAAEEPALVSIHAPARGATRSMRGSCSRSRMFQSTRPHGARHVGLVSTGRSPLFQSTRPHGARHAGRGANGQGVRVSIHAPARGATGAMDRGAPTPEFQSTRPHGARRDAAPERGRQRGFNPRARTGRDVRRRDQRAHCIHRFNPRARTGRDVDARVMQPLAHVSIHAPARGATRVPNDSCGGIVFQSTRPHGARRPKANPGLGTVKFQSTRPHGARLPSSARA